MTQPAKPNPLLILVFWRNPEIQRTSKLAQLVPFLLIPVAHFGAKYYVRPQTCAADIQSVSAVCFVLLGAWSICFWVFDGPKIRRALRDLVATQDLRLQRVLGGYELALDGCARIPVSFVVLVVCPLLYLIFAVFGCFWPASLRLICDRDWIGHPNVALPC